MSHPLRVGQIWQFRNPRSLATLRVLGVWVESDTSDGEMVRVQREIIRLSEDFATQTVDRTVDRVYWCPRGESICYCNADGAFRADIDDLVWLRYDPPG